MQTPTREDFDGIKILKTDKLRLDDHKVHPKQPYWEIVKLILDEKEVPRRR